jgi:2-polyprenyl-3-methyl-5-hydroxy-6-metoxy-1,4-benzoquinol methylase
MAEKMIDFTIENEEPSLRDASIIRDYSDFSGEDLDSILERIENHKRYVSAEYQTLTEKFYEQSQLYVYDILGGNPSPESRANLLNRFLPGIIGFINQHPGSSFVDFGGGVGAVCEIIKRSSSKDVTYVDIPSHMTEFAQWRFKKHSLDVNVVIIPEDDFNLPQQYDFIFSDAVWEHLPQPQQLYYAKKMPTFIKRGGYFILLIDLSGENEEMPMHFNVDINEVHKAISESGMVCEFGLHSFASVWRKE